MLKAAGEAGTRWITDITRSHVSVEQSCKAWGLIGVKMDFCRWRHTGTIDPEAMKNGKGNYVMDMTTDAKNDQNRVKGFLSVDTPYIHPKWHFLFLFFWGVLRQPLTGDRWTDSYAEYLKRCRSGQGSAFWGWEWQELMFTFHFGVKTLKIAPQFGLWNFRQFSSNMGPLKR